MTTDDAQFIHDCQCCTFLGTFRGGVPVMDYDLYWCEQAGEVPTVLARYGDEPSSYTSGLYFTKIHAALGEAKRRAKELGLNVGETP